MRLKSVVFALLAGTNLLALAQGTPFDAPARPTGKTPFDSPSTKAQATTCPQQNTKRLRNRICISMDSRSEDPKPLADTRFMYQRYILEASCADPLNDSDAEIRSKVQAMWSKYKDRLRCSGTTIVNGEAAPLRFALSDHFDAFFYDYLHWGLPLNEVDPSDKMTDLDWLENEVKRHPDSPFTGEYMSRIQQMREAGAKRASELH